MKSDSSLVTPKIRLVKPWLTKSPFQPVTGSMYHCQHQIKPYEGEDIRGGRKVVGWEKKIYSLTRMTGWIADKEGPSLRGEPRLPVRSSIPYCSAALLKNVASWKASLPSRNFAKSGERRE